MKTKKILFIAEVFFKFLGALIIISILFLFFVLVHSEYSPETYNKVTLKIHGGIEINYDPKTPLPPDSFAEHKEGNNKSIYFSKLTFSSKLRIIFRIFVFAGFFLLILNEFLNFIRSVKKYSTFFPKNYLHFKRIGIYLIFLLIYILYNGFKGWNIAMKFPDGYYYYNYRVFNLSIGSIIIYGALIILSFVVSQVFKEGERLRTENELTV